VKALSGRCEKVARVDFVVDNSGPSAETARQVDELLLRLGNLGAA